MSTVPSERKSWGPLIATIDLLFLVVAFFTLMLFFVQKERQETRAQLDRVQESVAAGMPANATPEQKGNALVTLVERMMTFQKEEQTREAKLQAQEERRSARQTVRVPYEVRPGPRIVYEGRSYTPAEFRSEVVAPLRKGSWLAFRAFAPPETPFGDVVATRKLLLENGAEFDTYWDNLAEGGVPAQK